tara:strand:+ start:2204 stop:2995 length:792 start_codon:yes stop_codon:yes gene_type:complete
MNLRTILNKTADAVKIILTQPTMLFTNKEEQTGVREHIVREDEVTRPDLIALEYYGDQSKTDIILKYNGISDPFSLQPGDVLEIPQSGIAFHKLERAEIPGDNKIKNQFLQGKRLSKKDDRRIDALKKKYNKDVLLPPNVIPIGKKNYKFDKGLVTFGAQAQNAEVNDPVVQQVLDETTPDPVFTPTDIDPGFESGFGGGRGLTENQLDKLLNDGVGKGKTSSGSGAGRGDTATERPTNKGAGDAPAGTNDAAGTANDGAPCN